jgi:arabinogalactan oligomer / maltooligosaccharide transport system permease protein
LSRASHRRRLAAGLAAALAVGVGLAWALLRAEVRGASDAAAGRLAVVSAQALAHLALQAWDRPEVLPGAVAAFQERAPGVRAARIVSLSGARLEASTAPEDEGERAAPRRLARDEKPVYDQAQRLRAAVGENRQEKGERPEIEIARLPGAGRVLSAAAPVESEGRVPGIAIVRFEAPPLPLPAPLGPGLAFALLAVPLALFGLAALLLGERRAPLAVAAAVALLGALAAAAAVSSSRVAGDHHAVEAAVDAHVRAMADAFRAGAGVALRAGEPVPSPATGLWDVDLLRRPRPRVGAEAEARVAAEIALAERDVRRSFVAVALLSVAVLLFVGLGWASRVGRALRVHRQAYLYVTPAMVGMLLLVFFPFAYGIAISFTDQNIYNTGRPLTEIWVGFDNYLTILGDIHLAKYTPQGGLSLSYSNFYWTLIFTVIWTVTNVTIGVTCGLVLALILDTKALAFRPIYRVLLILPWAMPNYITALVWRGMFHQQFGVVNQVVQLLGGAPIAWYDRPITSFFTALATNGWLSFPFMMVVSLGALQSIPADIYEAARVDGASRWQQFRAITLPSLKPALVPAVILSVVWTFNMFNIIYLVTAGEPGGSTEILVTQAYKYAFERYRYGYAAAYSTIIFGILLVYGTVQNRVSKATEAA